MSHAHIAHTHTHTQRTHDPKRRIIRWDKVSGEKISFPILIGVRKAEPSNKKEHAHDKHLI